MRNSVEHLHIYLRRRRDATPRSDKTLAACEPHDEG
jgi:hypothetical protein